MTESTLLFWTQPRLPSSDFTPADPLALEYLAQNVGNWLWPGFTTRTNRAFYYVMVCYGLDLAHRLTVHHGLPQTDASLRLMFERWEKLWALTICAHYGTQLPTVEAMRGRNGALKSHRQMRSADHYHLNYKLMARQLELGGLGAYLTSARRHGLVSQDRLRPTPLGAELARWMWCAPGDDDSGDDRYCFEALDPGLDNVVPFKVGRVSMQSLGQRARLCRMRDRPRLQAWLWNKLFGSYPPPRSLAILPEAAQALITAREAGVTRSRRILSGIVDGTFAPAARSSDNLRAASLAALRLGDLAASIRTAFDRAHLAVVTAGTFAAWDAVVDEAFVDDDHALFQERLARWWEAHEGVGRVERLSLHGPAFLHALREADGGEPAAVLDALLKLHTRVQRDRKKSGGWLRRDGNYLFVEDDAYHNRHLDPHVWPVAFKFGAMASLLVDLGKLS